MPFLHPNDALLVRLNPDLQTFTLVEPLVFRWRGRLLRVKSGATSDGMSAPKLLKSFLQDTNTGYPCVAHDGFYRDQIEESVDNGQTWTAVTFAKPDCDSALYDLLVDNRVSMERAEEIYEAVKQFGQKAFDEDRAAIKD